MPPSEALKQQATRILMSTGQAGTPIQNIGDKSISTVNDAKRLISRVKREVNRSAPKGQRRELNKQLDAAYRKFKEDFTQSLKVCNRELTRAEVESKILDDTSPRLARISASVKSVFRRESFSNLTHKIAKLTRHKPIQ